MPETVHQQRVLRALEAVHALRIDDGVFVEKWTVHSVCDNPRGIALTLEWSSESGYVWEVDFTEQSLSEAEIDGKEIRIADSEGEEVVIATLKLEAACAVVTRSPWRPP